MLLSEKMFYVLIAAVVFACGFGANEFYHTLDDKSQPIDCQDLEKNWGMLMPHRNSVSESLSKSK